VDANAARRARALFSRWGWPTLLMIATGYIRRSKESEARTVNLTVQEKLVRQPSTAPKSSWCCPTTP
jgi:hypothetical protein